MINLTEKELIDHLKQGGRFTLLQDGKECELSCQMFLHFNFDNLEDPQNGQTSFGAFEISFEEEVVFEAEDFSAVLDFFKVEALTVVKINDFPSMEAFLEKRAFDQADMKTLLEKYADCDEFALCAYVFEQPCALAEEEKPLLWEEIHTTFDTRARELYERYKGEYALPPLETLLADIREECLAYEKKKVEKGKGFYTCSMICDEVGKSTRYAEPTELFWHLYHESGRVLEMEREIENAPISATENGVAELEEEDYRFLKPYLLRFELTYKTHCTEGGLQKVCYFPLNEQTKGWLLKHENDYDFKGALQDLAFYKKGKLRFSSCTHEGFHDEVEEK